jgi:hypothetical protein
MRIRSTITASLLAVISALVMAGGAQAVVVDMNSLGQTTVAYDSSAHASYFGVAMVPGSRHDLVDNTIPTTVSSPPCNDPALTSDFQTSPIGLCWHGGPVLHRNETFALTWDGGQPRRAWQGTRGYIEQFLKDVADGSGTLTSPYAETGQYSDASGMAANSSFYGGGCIDNGNPGGWSCRFGDTTASGTGSSYPTTGNCTVTGSSYEFANPNTQDSSNDVCLTDAEIRAEVVDKVESMGFLSRTHAGYSPLVAVLLPAGVEACLDQASKLCSVNSSAPAKFCSYHGLVNVNGTDVPYVVQPWTPHTGCDEPDLPTLPTFPTADQLSTDAGMRIVNPLSQAQLAAITDPQLNGWISQDGSEINDNDGCVPLGKTPDTVTLGSSGQNPYYLQREFNNAGVMEEEPYAPACTPMVTLVPSFVVPSSPKPGEAIYFDGSATHSTLLVPKKSFVWNFGDGTTAIGPSVEHSYKQPGNYSVKLTVTDRGGNARSLAQTINVQGTQPSPPPNTNWTPKMTLLPQSLRSVLGSGVQVRVSSTKPADGVATLLITRGAAKRAHIKVGKAATVVIGRGTISNIAAGTSLIHLHINHGMAKKLHHVKHLKLTVRIKLFASSTLHVSLVAAGNY